ncbi:response regulator [uncultured Aquimarina sp.]|uniref:response regulator n=1 Tax=uncultured Aquimarina sp. TaxID=575652 RepID=UPI002629E58C|nr:response regulator [uncultured Aquimarina sp.]
MRKLKRFLLIDDSKATTFFNKTIILKTEVVEEIAVAYNGKEALDSLQSDSTPELIFLDLNMPVMNGWEFLDAYHHPSNPFQNSKIVVMLGAEIGKEERERLLSFSQVVEFRDKMLSKKVLEEIIQKYFAQEVSSKP